MLTLLDPAQALPDGHPAAGKGQQDGKATAYLCAGMVCSAPITDPAALREELQGR